MLSFFYNIAQDGKPKIIIEKVEQEVRLPLAKYACRKKISRNLRVLQMVELFTVSFFDDVAKQLRLWASTHISKREMFSC